MYRPVARQRFCKHIPAEAQAAKNWTSIARQGASKEASSTIERLCFLRSPSRVVIKKDSVEQSQLSEVERIQLKKSSFESVVVKDWVKFWRRQSKVTEKKWHERD
jgi:hypothetical protein